MTISSGLMVLALLAGDRPQQQPTEVRFNVHMVEMQGLTWRGEFFGQMTPVSRRGSITVWTTSAKSGSAIEAKASKVLAAPTVTSYAGTSIQVDSVVCRSVVVDMKRFADGPFNQSKMIAYSPQVDEQREGFQVELVGRPGPQGMMTRVLLKDSRIAAIHSYTITEKTVGDETQGAKPAVLATQVSVPEVITCEADGEWLIPNDGALVVSLGAFTVADAKGKAEVRERVALIVAGTPAGFVETDVLHPDLVAPPKPMAAPSVMLNPSMILPLAWPTMVPTAQANVPVDAAVQQASVPDAAKHTIVSLPLPSPLPFFNFQLKLAIDTTKMPMPALPARDMPTGITADGTVINLPQLPDTDDEVVVVSAQPMPAPQSKIARPVPGALVKATTPSPEKCEESDVVIYPATALRVEATPCPDKADAVDAKPTPVEIQEWMLTLPDAIKIGLGNSNAVRVLASEGRDAIVIQCFNADDARWKLKAEVSYMVRCIEQQYWLLHQAQVKVWAKESALDLACKTEQRDSVMNILFDQSELSCELSRGMIAKFRCDLEDAESECKTIQSQLHLSLGLAETDKRVIVTATAPQLARVSYDLETCLRESNNPRNSRDPVAGLELKSKLTRMIGDLNLACCSFQTATSLKNCDKDKVDLLAASWKKGETPTWVFLEAVENWSASVIEEQKDCARCNTMIAAVEDAKGTLLAKHDVMLLPHLFKTASKTSDTDVARTSMETPSAAKVVFECDHPGCVEIDDEDDDDSDPFGLIGFKVLNPNGSSRYDGEMGIGSLQDEPITLRVPTAGGGVVEITAKLVKKPSLTPAKTAK